MNLRGYKTAPPTAVRLHGRLLWLALLSRLRLQQAEALAAAFFRAHRVEPRGPYFEIALRIHVLAAAMDSSAAELLEQLDPSDVKVLWLAWSAHQGELAAVKAPGVLREELRKRVNDDADVLADGQAAYLAGPQEADPAGFYGRPLGELTDAQVDYYTFVRAAFVEFHLEGKHKEVSAQWLKSPST